jgi:hypothetical protein
MIIFGHRARTTAIGEGTFHCPKCQIASGYTHQRVRRWFTLYFLPVLPLADLAEHIQCHNCGGLWDPELRTRRVTTLSVDQVERELRRALRRAIAMVILAKPGRADGRPPRAEDDPSVIEAGSRAFHRATGMALASADLAREMDELRAAGTDVRSYLGRVGGILTPGLKESIVTAACEVALHDGRLEPKQLAAIEQVVGALGLADEDLRKVLARAQARPPQRS